MGELVLSHRRPLYILTIVLIGFLVYSNTFGVPFLFDDFHAILGNRMILDVSNIPRLFTGGDWPFSSRPMLHATNAINYYLGGANPEGYHLVNVVVHLLNASLLYLLILITGRRLGSSHDATRAVAVLSSLLFVAHPAQTEAVTNIANRSALFAATFCFLGLILFLKAVVSEKKRVIYAMGLFLVSMLGMASRENFATFPLLLIIFDILFVSRFRLRDAVGHYKLYLAASLPLGYLVFLALNNTYDTVTPTLAGLTPYQYALTELNVQWTYLRLILLPFNQTLDYDYESAKSLLALPTALAFAGYLGLWVLGVLFAKRRPVAAFGVIWFLITLLPISFGVALLEIKLDDVIFEHRIYLPSAGIIVAISSGVVMLNARYPRAHKVLTASCAAAVFTLGVAAHVRNYVWQDEIRLWADVIHKAPYKVRGYNNLGFAYEQRGQLDKAIEYYKRALGPGMSLAPPMYLARVHFNIAHVYDLTDQLENEMEHTTIGIMLNRPTESPYSSTGDDYLKKGAVDEAIKYYLMAIESTPNFAPARYGLGNAYRAKGLAEKAIEEYSRAIELKPDYAEAHVNIGILYKSSGRLDKAIDHYSRAIDIRPDSSDAHYNIANAYLLRGDVENAIEHYEQAIILTPDDPAIHKNLSVAYQKKGMPEKAREHLRIAESLGQK